MIRVRLDHIPDVADQDFDCETAAEAVKVLAEYGVTASERQVSRGAYFELHGADEGGVIEVTTEGGWR